MTPNNDAENSKVELAGLAFTRLGDGTTLIDGSVKLPTEVAEQIARLMEAEGVEVSRSGVTLTEAD